MEPGLEPSHAAAGPAARTGHASDVAAARSRHADFVTLTKPRLNSLVLVTTLATYFLGGGYELPWVQLAHIDWHRARGRRRLGVQPVVGARHRSSDAADAFASLADRRLHPQDGLWFAVLLTALGIADLTLGVNALTAAVAAATLVSYVLLYTPLKFEPLYRPSSARFLERCPP